MHNLIYGYKLISKGAEAYIYLCFFGKFKAIRKIRVRKMYRIPEVDKMIRRLRTKREAKLLHLAKKIGIPTPIVFDVDLRSCSIVMEFIEGDLLKNAILRGDISHEEAVKIFEKIGDQHSLAFAIGDIGMVCFRSGELESAREYLESALAAANRLKDEEFILESTLRLAVIRLRDDRLREDETDEYIAAAGNIGSAELTCKSYVLKGLLLLETGCYRDAEQVIEKLAAIETIKENPELELPYLELKIIYSYLTGDRKTMIRLLKKALALAFSKDLAIMAMDLAAIAEACSLGEEIPARLTIKIDNCFKRIKGELGEEKYGRFMDFYRRRINTIKTKTVNQAQKRDYNRPRVAD